MKMEEKVKGSLFGLAYGDALGAETEFLSLEGIRNRWPPYGPVDFDQSPIRVTDDTQMSLCVGQALCHSLSDNEVDRESFEKQLKAAFVQWLVSPDNNRAPGRTCLSACEGLTNGSWLDATIRDSKGCGANMRVFPLGLVDISEEQRAELSQLQAAYTHGHPTALAASDLSSFCLRRLLEGSSPDVITGEMRAYIKEQKNHYHPVLSSLWTVVPYQNKQEFINHGWNECEKLMDDIERGADNAGDYIDPCIYTGEGWIAEEALATGLLAFLLHKDNPQKAIARAAATEGDSDSIAAFTGAFSGAVNGMKGWPSRWFEDIEYQQQLMEQSTAFGATWRTQ